ncbi:hypothetical protein JQ578_47920, partial [Bradyrhizobium liaoningense]|nr:hypothetical protein [Bradyrhizobium liaoningense]
MNYVVVTNLRDPQIPAVPEEKRAELERIVTDARVFLFDAGCRALDSNFDNQHSAMLAPEVEVDPIGPEDGDPMQRAGPGCLDSAPLDLSGFLPGYAERGA